MNRTSLAVILTIGAISVAGFWMFLLLSVKNKESKIAFSVAEFSAIQDRNAKLASMNALAEDLKSNMSALDKAFVKRDEVPSFVDNLEKLATKSRVKISVSDLSVSDIDPAVTVGSLRVRADVEGGELATHHFVKTLESSEPILVINRAVFTKFEDDKKNSIWRVSLDIKGYVIN